MPVSAVAMPVIVMVAVRMAMLVLVAAMAVGMALGAVMMGVIVPAAAAMMIVPAVLVRMVVVVMVMPVVVVAARLGGGTFRAEGPGDLAGRGSEAPDRLEQSGVEADMEDVLAELSRRVAVAEMPGDLDEPDGIVGRHLDQALGRGLDPHEPPVLELHGVAVFQNRLAVEIEQEREAALPCQLAPLPVARLVIERHRIGDALGLHGGAAEDGRGTEHLDEPQSIAAGPDAGLQAAAIARNEAARPQNISNSPAAPMPPPTHIVTTPYFAPRRLPSIRTWPVMRAPDMP